MPSVAQWATSSATMEESTLLGFEHWADVIRWVRTNQGRKSHPTYYVSPTVHDEGRPVRVQCTLVHRHVNGKAEHHLRVLSHPFESQEVAPFEANADHVRCFRRSESSTLLTRLPDAGRALFDVFKHLPEPEDGPLCICERCSSVYRALDFQPRNVCKDCRPPTQRCRHGFTNFERCLECKKVTGGDIPSVGLTRIVLKRR